MDFKKMEITPRVYVSKVRQSNFYQIKDKQVFWGGFGAFCLDSDVCCCSTGLKNGFKSKSNTVSQKSTCQSQVSESPSSH